jgi:hypothetical protein
MIDPVNLVKKWKYDIIVLAVYSITFFVFFTEFPRIDIKDHNQLLTDYLIAGFFPVPPGYYFLVYLLDFLIRVKYPFVASALLVLTFSSWWKFQIVFSWLKMELNINDKYVFLVSLTLVFMSPIYIPMIDGGLWYMGKFTSTIWHNSTLIAVFPLCLLITKVTLRWLENQSAKAVFFILFLGLLILLIKPSFLFCFVPAFPIYTLFSQKKINSKVIQATGISFILFVLILLEKYLIFNWDPMISILYTSEERSQVILAPMKVWLFFSDQPVFDFLSSFPLIIGFLIFWKREAFKSTFFSFSFMLLFFAISVYGLFSETGFREFHGNFYWQIPISLLLTNLSIVTLVIRDFLLSKAKPMFSYFILLGIFLLQGVLGLNYWFRIFSENTVS